VRIFGRDMYSRLGDSSASFAHLQFVPEMECADSEFLFDRASVFRMPVGQTLLRTRRSSTPSAPPSTNDFSASTLTFTTRARSHSIRTHGIEGVLSQASCAGLRLLFWRSVASPLAVSFVFFPFLSLSDFKQIQTLGADAHLNTCFKHFM
jgi:hypothetical protein